MAFIPVPDTVQVDFVGTLGGQTVVWGWQWERAGGFSSAGADTLAGDMWTWWDGDLRPLLSADYTLNFIRVTDLSSATGFVIEWDDNLPDAGIVAGGALPANVAVVVSFKTGNRGRAFRGRCYLPGIPEADVSVNTLDAADRTALAAAFASSTSIGSVLGADQVVASRTTNPGFTTVVTEHIVRPTVHTQRRRLPG